MFTFSDSNFTGATYAASIGNNYTGGKNYDTSGISGWGAAQVAVDGDGNRIAIGDFAEDDIYLFGFEDTSLTGASLKYTIGFGKTGTNELDTSTATLADDDQFPNYIALDDTGTLMVAGSARGDGASDAGDNTGDISLWADTIIRGNTSYTDCLLYTSPSPRD